MEYQEKEGSLLKEIEVIKKDIWYLLPSPSKNKLVIPTSNKKVNYMPLTHSTENLLSIWDGYPEAENISSTNLSMIKSMEKLSIMKETKPQPNKEKMASSEILLILNLTMSATSLLILEGESIKIDQMEEPTGMRVFSTSGSISLS